MLVLRVGTARFSRQGGDIDLLQGRGIRAEQAGSGKEALEFLRLYDYDLVLMDFRLPDMAGHEAVRQIRAAEFNLPIVMLADASAPAQVKIHSLDNGADDFVTAPCEFEELLARLRAVVRRSQGHRNSTLRLGPVELSLDRREVRVSGQKMQISRREFAVLELLFLKQGVILNKTAFLNHVYCGMEEPEMKTIDVIICRLRKKLATAGVPTLIDTVWGCGYILREPLPMDAPANEHHHPMSVAA
jgi:two-component system cell cycle response regulator CtrA